MPEPEVLEVLAHIHAQTEAARAELAGLRLQLEQVKRALANGQAAQLRDANERLVLAALAAQELADLARNDLDTLMHESQRDLLTGIPNRALMQDRLQSAILLAQRRDTKLAVLFVDIDDFKGVNDTHGHAMGDAVLRCVARCLSDAVRHSDTVSRHGGDEFLILLAEVTAPEDAALVAVKVRAGLAAARGLGQPPIRLSASLGIAMYPQDGNDASTLIERADGAMYRAKQAGGGGFAFHTTPET